MPDRDLEDRRVGQRVDPATNILYTMDVWNPDRPEAKPNQDGEGEEEEEEEEEEEAEEGLGEEEVNKRRMRRDGMGRRGGRKGWKDNVGEEEVSRELLNTSLGEPLGPLFSQQIIRPIK